MTDHQLNMVLAELMGYTVDKGRPGRVLKENMSSMPTDYCTDPAASLEVQTKAIEVDAPGYLYNLATVVNGYEAADIWEDDEIISILKATPRERAEAAYITLQGAKGNE
ncbi:hypothetical protein BJP48_31650 [Paenibacillus odorifer]|nr:hypothetical protein BJP48_31650 [Paenibacillus odorifer]